MVKAKVVTVMGWLCAGWGEPGRQWTQWGWRNEEGSDSTMWRLATAFCSATNSICSNFKRVLKTSRRYRKLIRAPAIAKSCVRNFRLAFCSYYVSILYRLRGLAKRSWNFKMAIFHKPTSRLTNISIEDLSADSRRLVRVAHYKFTRM